MFSLCLRGFSPGTQSIDIPQSKDMHVRLIGGSILLVGVIVSVHGCWSTCGPVMDWRPVQGGPLSFTWRELG